MLIWWKAEEIVVRSEMSKWRDSVRKSGRVEAEVR